MSSPFAGVFDPDEAYPDVTRENWRLFAACNDRDPEDFFPDSLRKQREVARYCHGFCPTIARKACLENALRSGQKHGVAGGMTDKERSKLSKDYSPWAVA